MIYLLPADLKSWDRQPLKFDLSVDAPALYLCVPDSGATLKGALRFAGKRQRPSPAPTTAALSFEGRGIESMGLTVRSIDARLEAADNQARLSQLEVVFNEKNAIHGEGKCARNRSFRLLDRSTCKFRDLSILQPLLEQEALVPALGGALIIGLKGTGDLRAHHNTPVTPPLI